MSSRKHTSGPWRVVGPPVEGKNPNTGLWCVEGLINVANDCTYADANLISAAPDLLYSVKALLALIDAECSRLLDGDRGGDGILALKIEEYLAKAEGRL